MKVYAEAKFTKEGIVNTHNEHTGLMENFNVNQLRKSQQRYIANK